MATTSLSDEIIIGIGISLVVVPFLVIQFTPTRFRPNWFGAEQIFPNKVLSEHELAYSRAKHDDKINKLIHVLTNPLIFLSLVS